jgi:hypothetical protein
VDALVERRSAPRTVLVARDTVFRVRVRGGRELTVLNASASGVWVEGATRLLPGATVDVIVPTPTGQVLARSRVTRACVADIRAEGVLYRAALAFDRRLDIEVG